MAEVKKMKKGNVKIKLGEDGQEIKTSVTIRCEATIWNKAHQAAAENGFTLNAMLRKYLIDLGNEIEN